MKKYNWAILGAGRIAEKFAQDLTLLPNANVYAIGSRSIEKSKAFALNFNVQKAYGSYEEMLSDKDIDVVYIATPHSHHKEHTLLALKYGKKVLCEKAFALNASDAQEMISFAKKKDLFLMEGFWTRILPSFQKAYEIIQSGELGKIHSIKSDFGFKANFDPQHRLFNQKLGGGSLLDIGLYPVFAALIFLGNPKEIKTVATFNPQTHTEESIGMLFQYEKGEIANLFSTLKTFTGTETDIYCDNGYVRIHKQWHKVAPVTVHYNDGTQKTYPFESRGWGYQFEAQEVMNCLDQNLKEHPLLNHQFTIELMQLLDRVRKDANIEF